jgi:predicted nucleic acid-binding protein
VLARWVDLSESDASIAYSPVSLAELRAAALAFLALTCVPIDRGTGRQAGDYLRRYRKSHGVDLGDALIAPSAVVQGAIVWTRNRKRFPMRELRFF